MMLTIDTKMTEIDLIVIEIDIIRIEIDIIRIEIEIVDIEMMGTEIIDMEMIVYMETRIETRIETVMMITIEEEAMDEIFVDVKFVTGKLSWNVTCLEWEEVTVDTGLTAVSAGPERMMPTILVISLRTYRNILGPA